MTDIESIVNGFTRDHEQEMYRERWLAAAADRTIDVVAVIGQPFSYRDVQVALTRVMLADGWADPPVGFGTYSVVHSTMRDLEDASLIVRTRAQPGYRPHLFVRTQGRRYHV
jgi:hypothetical protein